MTVMIFVRAAGACKEDSWVHSHLVAFFLPLSTTAVAIAKLALRGP